MIYSGAGVSTSAGIGQAARSGQRKMTGGATTEAAPTAAHLALVSLYNRCQIYLLCIDIIYIYIYYLSNCENDVRIPLRSATYTFVINFLNYFPFLPVGFKNDTEECNVRLPIRNNLYVSFS